MQSGSSWLIGKYTDSLHIVVVTSRDLLLIVIAICSGHTLLFEDSIDLAALLEKYGFAPPASDVNLTEEAKENMQNKKHAVPDENYDEMGLILEPWRVSSSIYHCQFKLL